MGIPTKCLTKRPDIAYNTKTQPMLSLCKNETWLAYKFAQDSRNKIALGHHFDDVIETILMSMVYGGQIQTMMPKLHSRNYAGMELIRPLYMVKEADIIRWVEQNDLHFIRCACRFTESYEG